MDPRPYNYEYRKPRFSNPTFQSNNLYGSIYHFNPSSGPKRFEISERVDKIVNSPPKNFRSYQLPVVEQQIRGQELISPRMDIQPVTHIRQSEKNQVRAREPEENGNHFRGESVPVENAQHGQIPRQQKQYQSSLPKTKTSSEPKQRPSSKSQPYNEISSPIHKHKMNNEPYSYSTSSQEASQQGNLSSYGGRIMRPIPGIDQDRIYQRQQKGFNIINLYPKQHPNIHRKYPKLTLENELLESSKYEFYRHNSQSYQPR